MIARLDCAHAGAWMAAAEAGSLSEADACRLEAHLGSCACCRGERARIAALGELLREAPGSTLTDAALQRAAARALGAGAPPAGRSVRPRVVLVAAGLAAMALAAVLLWPPSEPLTQGPAVLRGAIEARGAILRAGAAVRPGVELRVIEPSTVRMGGVRIEADGRTRLVVDGRSQVTLAAGKVRVAVRRGTPFAVRTDLFAAHVLGTRFAVTRGSVEVWEGRVRVVSPAGAPLALLGAGERHEVSPIAVRAPAPERPVALESAARPAPPSAAVPEVSMPWAARPRLEPPAPVATGPAPSIAAARQALRERHTAKAREILDALIASGASRSAEIWTLRADSLRLERRHAEAARAYHDVASRYRGSATAEAALFTAAQLELERLGRPAEALRSLREYRRLYPSGRFAPEVVRLIDRLSHQPR